MKNCYFENLSNVHGNALKVIKRNGNEYQITRHLPNSLVEKTASLMRHVSFKSLKLKSWAKELLNTRNVDGRRWYTNNL